MALFGSETILLQPRPYAQSPGKLLLLPLMPIHKPLKALPAELWGEIFTFAVTSSQGHHATAWAFRYLTICKSLKPVVLRALYAGVTFASINSFEKFYKCLFDADQKWDSIRRIPYSAPGRWVQELHLSNIEFVGVKQALLLDSILTQLFPLIPFLQYLSINPSFVMSRRVLQSLAQRDGAANLRVLKGVSYFRPVSVIPDEDLFVQLLRWCSNIEELEIIGHGSDSAELPHLFETITIRDEQDSYPRGLASFTPLDLPRLHTLTLLSMHYSPLMLALLHSSLPALQKLTLTPYDDVPHPISFASQIILVHGKNLRSLSLLTPKFWPTRLHPSPVDLLQFCPNLQHLSLERPLPRLTLFEKHPLRILSVPRPDAEFWPVLDKLLHRLPHLHSLRTRDVRKLKKGLSSRAQEAGVQGEAKEWRRRLLRRGVRVLDADWNEFD